MSEIIRMQHFRAGWGTHSVLDKIESALDRKNKLPTKFVCQPHLNFKGHSDVVPAAQIFVNEQCVVVRLVRLVCSSILGKQVVVHRPAGRGI